jgi:hypothetical protein
MYLFNRTMETTGEVAKIVPILHDMKKAVQDAGVDATVWIGGNGYKSGTVIITTPYATLADRAAATAKLGANKSVAAVYQRMNPFVVDQEPDIILQYVKGGTFAATVPVGAVVTLVQSQLAQGADWMKTMEWAMELAELDEKITGTQSNLGMVMFGPLGGFIHFSGFANAAAAEAALDAKSANTDWLPLFLKGTPYVLAGSVMSRQMTKIA